MVDQRTIITLTQKMVRQNVSKTVFFASTVHREVSSFFSEKIKECIRTQIKADDTSTGSLQPSKASST